MMFKYCPKCGKELTTLDNDGIMQICCDSSCRTVIKNDNIQRLDIEVYSEIEEALEPILALKSKKPKTFMLLNDNGKPLLIKNTSKPTELLKNTYCIVRATDLEHAVEQFRKKFQYIEVTKANVIEVIISSRV